MCLKKKIPLVHANLSGEEAAIFTTILFRAAREASASWNQGALIEVPLETSQKCGSEGLGEPSIGPALCQEACASRTEISDKISSLVRGEPIVKIPRARDAQNWISVSGWFQRKYDRSYDFVIDMEK